MHLITNPSQPRQLLFRTVIITIILTSITTITASNLPKLEKDVLIEADWKLNSFYSVLDQNDLDQTLPEISHYKTTPWPVGQLPASCVRAAESTNCPVDQVRAYSVHYNDCPNQSWPMCYCHSSETEISLSKLISTFGKVPALARPYIRTMMGMPPKLTYTAYHLAGDLVAVSDIKFRTMMHELAHALDRGKEDYTGRPAGAEPRVKWRSESEGWKEALKKDTCVLTRYALTNVREAFAVVSVLVLLEVVDAKIYEKLEKEFDGLKCMRNQLEYARKELKAFLVPTQGVCPDKVNPEPSKMWVDVRQARRGLDGVPLSYNLPKLQEEEDDQCEHIH